MCLARRGGGAGEGGGPEAPSLLPGAAPQGPVAVLRARSFGLTQGFAAVLPEGNKGGGPGGAGRGGERPGVGGDRRGDGAAPGGTLVEAALRAGL